MACCPFWANLSRYSPARISSRMPRFIGLSSIARIVFLACIEGPFQLADQVVTANSTRLAIFFSGHKIYKLVEYPQHRINHMRIKLRALAGEDFITRDERTVTRLIYTGRSH